MEKSALKILAALIFSVVSLSASAASLLCTDLTGKVYLGVEGQGGEPQERCEGCGADGIIEFMTSTEAAVIHAGSDIIERCTYMVESENVEFRCEFSGRMTLTISPDCKTLSSKEGVFIRTRTK